MTLTTSKSAQRGIAMTEYLIMLAIVAVAAIAVVSFFGKQIKSTFNRSNQALIGEVVTSDSGTATKSKATADKSQNFGTFTEDVKAQ
jgi:pilus assembly protein Flp/PilA